MLMEQFAARDAASQRCANVRTDGTVVRHTVSLVRATNGLLSISSDMDTPPDASQHRVDDGHASLLDVSARITADMHSQRERTGAPAVSAADIAAAALDELDDALDDLERLKAEQRAEAVDDDEASLASPTADASSAVASLSLESPEIAAAAAVTSTGQPAASAAVKEARTHAIAAPKQAGAASYDSTMTDFAAELAVEEAEKATR